VRGLGVAAGVAARHLGVSTQSVLRGLEIAEELLEQRSWTLRAISSLPSRLHSKAP